jgi:hypothetical protein
MLKLSAFFLNLYSNAGGIKNVIGKKGQGDGHRG